MNVVRVRGVVGDRIERFDIDAIDIVVSVVGEG